MYVIKIIFNKLYLKKIEPTLLYLYGFERADNKNNRENNREED
jgi:hypothetical protein